MTVPHSFSFRPTTRNDMLNLPPFYKCLVLHGCSVCVCVCVLFSKNRHTICTLESFAYYADVSVIRDQTSQWVGHFFQICIWIDSSGNFQRQLRHALKMQKSRMNKYNWVIPWCEFFNKFQNTVPVTEKDKVPVIGKGLSDLKTDQPKQSELPIWMWMSFAQRQLCWPYNRVL